VETNGQTDRRNRLFYIPG